MLDWPFAHDPRAVRILGAIGWWGDFGLHAVCSQLSSQGLGDRPGSSGRKLDYNGFFTDQLMAFILIATGAGLYFIARASQKREAADHRTIGEKIRAERIAAGEKMRKRCCDGEKLRANSWRLKRLARRETLQRSRPIPMHSLTL